LSAIWKKHAHQIWSLWKLASVCFFKLHEKPYYYLLTTYMKKWCSHVRKSHLEIKKIKKIKKLENRKLRNLHCISFFGIVFRKNCTALSQSELRNFPCILLVT
jgi:hypothetical protein